MKFKLLSGYPIGAQANTKFSPFHLLYGRKAVLRLESIRHPRLLPPCLQEDPVGKPPQLLDLHVAT